MSEGREESQKGKKPARRLRKGRVVIVLAIIFCLFGAACAIFRDDNQPVAGLITHAQGRINILVLGVDEREDDVGRSDTTFVVTVDTDARKVTMLSIPRDSRVKIPGHGWDKINHAYAFGGSKLAKTTIEDLLGIPLDYTVVINFNGFVRMIDAIGGVTINVDKPMHYTDPYDDDGGLYIDLHPGVQKLTGRTAIEYVRYRDEEGDIGRVARQQKFLKAVMQEFTKPQLITRLPELVKQFSTAVRTDMPTSKMLQLIPIANDAVKAGLETQWVTGTPIWIQDVSYWLPDIKELRIKVAAIQGIAVDEKYRQAAELLAAEYKQSIPKEIKVADVPPVIQRTSSVEKPAAAVTKAPAAANKSKTAASGQNKVGSNLPSGTTGTNSGSAAGDGKIHKNTGPDAAGKQ
ncbi:MAG: LCP family protein [Veillonellales bacterium]